MSFSTLKLIFSSSFLRNVGWLGAAEMVNRVFRLGTTVTLARSFGSEEYGLMAVIYTTFEFASVLTLRDGIGSKIVQADEQEIHAVCNTAYWLNWLFCIAMFLIQCFAAFPIAHFYRNDQLILPLCVVGLVYLMLPTFMIQSALIHRENRLKIRAMCNAAQSIVLNILTIILAALQFKIWAIVIPMVISTPIWTVITWRNHAWRPPKTIHLEKWRDITSFGGQIFAIEVLKKLRGNIDYLIAGRFLGMEALGLYFFAFNAGLGISLNVINLCSSAVLPHLCQARDNQAELKQRYFKTIKQISAIVVPLVLLQASLAPLYVPIIFGQKWSPAVPILMLICLSALMFPVAIVTNEVLNALGKVHITLYWNLFYTILFTLAILVGVQWGLWGIVIAVLACQVAILPLFSIWTNRTFFSQHSS
ncbi:lipopolysaccharide biosynthesis protein [Pseudanabaenaceae cyanobacterium LEGE 13415]|nr:lipopolysaccharide biosynthesis protein [Pseudanabaenaceae cyanobacterium LEGE 13415]